MERRKALKNIGISLGSMTLTPSLVGIFQSCQSETDWTPRFFSLDQNKIVSKFLEIIIPETDGIPGASELKLIRYIDAYASFAQEKNIRGIKNLDSLISNTLSTTSKSNINKLTSDDCENQLKKYLLAEENQIKQWTILYNEYWSENNTNKEVISEEALAYFSIFTIRNWAISAYRYNNEFIAKNVLDFRPIPGEQKGCVDLQETTGGLVWAVQ
jgi:hypothetical protein